MKLVIITREAIDPREPAILAALFAAGLERCHVRKPAATRAELESWLRAVPAEFHSRLVLHQHHDLVGELRLGGCHWRDDDHAPLAPPAGSGCTSRSCHDLKALRSALGRYDSVFFGPVFPSISKPGRAPSKAWSFPVLRDLLTNRTSAQRRTTVIALGGVTATHISRCRELGFDGVAVLGTLWQAADPISAFAQLQAACRVAADVSRRSDPSHVTSAAAFAAAPESRCNFPVMAITQDGLAMSHLEQAEQLCAAGARWIQLRMKNAAPEAWLATARAVAAVCRAHDTIFVVNDSVDIALEVDADGVHLGKLDLDWREARRRLGPQKILGGTVNDSADAALVRKFGCLDYVGVGPLRFTTTKQKLAPVLGLEGVRDLIAELGGLPAWVIGGVEPADLPALRAADATGVAVSSALFRGGRITENLRAFHDAWAAQPLFAS